MKRIISIILTVITICCLFTGCGKNSDNANNLIVFKNKTLSDFIPSDEEYIKQYKKAGLPFDSAANIGNGATRLYIKEDAKKKDVYQNIILNPLGTTGVVHAIWENNRCNDIDYMFAPAFLYIKDVPGAITDVYEIIEKLNIGGASSSDQLKKYEYTENGITYYYECRGSEYYGYAKVTVDKTYTLSEEVCQKHEYKPGSVTQTLFKSEWLNLKYEIPTYLQPTKEELETNKKYQEMQTANGSTIYGELEIYGPNENTPNIIIQTDDYIGKRQDVAEYEYWESIKQQIESYGAQFAYKTDYGRYDFVGKTYRLYKVETTTVRPNNVTVNNYYWRLFRQEGNKTITIQICGTENEILEILKGFTAYK